MAVTTFLDMVNRLLTGLREERIGVFTVGNAQHDSMIDLVNDGARSILERVQWPFDERSDLVIDWNGRDYAGSESGTTGSITNATTVTIDAGTHAKALLLAAELASTRRIFRIELGAVTTTDSGTLLNAQSYVILKAEPDAVTDDVVLTLRDPLMAEDGTPAAAGPISWELYSYETVLPETVRAVFELWNEERPISVLYEDPAHLRRVNPRPQDHRGDPLDAYLFGYGTSTSAASALVANSDAVSGTLLSLSPVPDKVLRIHGSYLYRHPKMTLVTETLVNVPESVVDMVVRMALILALEGMEGNDPVRAASMRRQLFGGDRSENLTEGGEFGRIFRGEQNRTPNQRHVMPSFGRAGHVPARQRWASQTVPAPT